MSDNQTVVPAPPPQERTDAQETPPPPQDLDLIAVKLTDTGRVRSHNEDYVDYVVPPDPQQQARKGAIYLVADGMGGHQAGEVASRGAVELVSQRYYADTSRDVGTSLVRAVQSANQQLYAQARSDPSKSGMGTTLVAAVTLGRKVYVANVGDSRAYLINKTNMTQITEDHSWVEEQVRAGLLTQEQAKRHPQRNLVTRALGSKPAVDVDLFEGEIGRGDTLLLCSDGLTGRVEDHEIAAIVRAHPPTEAARLLVAAANERGGSDNITVLIVSTEKEAAAAVAAVPPVAAAVREPARRRWLIPALVGGVAIVALVLGILWATGTLFGGKPTETAEPPVATATETLTPEASATADMGLSPISTPAMTETVASDSPTATLAPTSAEQPEATPTSTISVPTVDVTVPIPTVLPSPSLTSPASSSDQQGFVTFEWRYTGDLGQDEAFQVLIWKEGASDHPGAAQSWSEPKQTIDLDHVPQLVAGGPGPYLWSVVVVRRGTDERLSPEAPPRDFTYLGPAVPKTPTATPSNTLPPTKVPPTPTDTPAPTAGTPSD
ncbi:MAG: Stp1/IreP family PP2C-type Ser/Thr phosphatase [Anaerolineae bacterium]|jgi:serine/threonine protein phosphatase PrpC